MCLVDLNMGTIQGMTHIKTIFSYGPGTSELFIDTTLHSSDDCYTFIYISDACPNNSQICKSMLFDLGTSD
jgi:hypothetical protein